MEDIWSKKHRERVYTEPCSSANAISYKTFCQLGALLNPKLRRMGRQNGTHVYSTYHLLSY